jgi:Tol biopolymer transport system component/predicted Ser/Thr protein kinase
MDARTWQTVKEWLAEAANLPAEDRGQFVVEHCPDPELRREILDMLASPAVLSEIISARALATGDRLGPYLIDRMLGRGGMGVVYRARDTRLNRTVAIKVLPPELSTDPARRERFDREAHAVAALDDPHICTLYDVGHDNGIDFLVMQYLEGETLAARLARGRLPLDEVLRLASDIATALDRAHRAGVVHRDLKPGNIMLTKAGAVLLDFGLARVTPSVADSPSAASTALASLTEVGTLIGTLHYMSPEQVEGREADGRSDLFAFGAVLYEMATGRKAFDGDSQAGVLGAVLKDQPPSITVYAPTVPPDLNRLVSTCLAKHPDERFQSAHDVAIALRWLRDANAHPIAAKDGRLRRSRYWFAGAAAASIVAAAAAGFYLGGLRRLTRDTSPAVRFDLPAPSGWRFAGPPAVSPDDRHVIAVANNDKGGHQQLWLRTLDEADGRFLPGTDRGDSPFWSPDSTAVGFFADGKLKRIDIRSLSTITVCDAPNPRGGAWTSDGQIVFAPGMFSGLVRVPATGGDPVPLTTLAKNQMSHRFPATVENRQLTFQVTNQNGDENGTWLLSLDDPQHALRIVKTFDRGIVANNRLFWTSDGTLLTQRLDPSTGSLSGEKATVVNRVGRAGVQGLSAFSISSGALVYLGSSLPSTQLAWVARNGGMLESTSDVGHFLTPRLSPDGDRIAYVRFEGDRSDLWVVDLERHAATRVLSQQNRYPMGNLLWRDGSRIAFQASGGPGGMAAGYLINAAGGPAAPVLTQLSVTALTGWTPDGQTAIWTQTTDQSRITGQVGGRAAIMIMGPDQKPVTYFDPGYWIEHATLSPDGHWMAFSSDQSGPRQVFVVGFPEPGRPQQVSDAGGSQPRWRSDSRELFFLAADSKLMAVSVKTEGRNITIGRPQPLFDAPMPQWPWDSTDYDVSQDGQRFLINVVREQHAAPITVILNWRKLIAQQ